MIGLTEREFKFRAWDTLGKGYINGFNMIGFSTGQGAPEKKLQRYSQIWREPDSYILEQFTGRRDAKRTEKYPKGQEIYEGDVGCGYTTSRVGVGTNYYYGKVVWSNEYSRFEIESPDGGTESLNNIHQFKVSGDIHRNPELMKTESNEEQRTNDNSNQ